MNRVQRTEKPDKPVYYLISIVIGFVLAFVVLEVFFRVLPVNDVAMFIRVDERFGVKYFAPDENITWSTGTTFAFRTSKKSNNFGFLSDYDFHPVSSLPLIVVIGDSYVEAAQVANRRSHHSLLHAGLGGRGRVYGIGSSGSPLSNYLKYARMAKEQFSPDGMIFVIVGNDFDESMCQYYQSGAGTWCFEPIGSEDYGLRKIDPPLSLLRRLARQSALARYLVFNAQVDWRAVVGRLQGKGERVDKYVGNTVAAVSPERLKQSQIAVDEFFDRLPAASGLAAESISFVLDGIRQGIYESNSHLSDSYFGRMRQYVRHKGASLGYEIIDLHGEFVRDYAANKERFEFPIDGHWNELGHYLAACAIRDSRVFRRVFAIRPDLGLRPSGIVY